MPRVVQVVSKDSIKELEQISDFNYNSDSDDVSNRNFNQRSNVDTLTPHLRFNVNYAQYNVEYIDAENEPYCLRRLVDGEIRKYKKDARTWLHKSSERKRKREKEPSEQQMNISPYGMSFVKNSRMTFEPFPRRIPETVGKTKNFTSINQFLTSGGTENKKILTAVTDDEDDTKGPVKSELSCLADSEADLTYSEESSPTLVDSDLDTRNDVKRMVTNFRDVESRYRTDTSSSSSSEKCNADESPSQDKEINESQNNMYTCTETLDVTRIAPAISMETESLHETLLDYAVNLENQGLRRGNNRKRNFSGTTYSSLRRTSPHHTQRQDRRRDKRKSRDISYNLRSLKKNELLKSTVPQNKQRRSKPYQEIAPTELNTERPVQQEKSPQPSPAFTDFCLFREPLSPLIGPVTEAPSCGVNLANPGTSATSTRTVPDVPDMSRTQSSGLSLPELPGCSTDSDDTVPSLFLLSSLALYKVYMSKLSSF